MGERDHLLLPRRHGDGRLVNGPSDIQLEVARVLFELPQASSFMLVGGCALLLRGDIDRSTRDLDAARAAGTRHLTTIVAVGNHGRGPVGPCGRDRQMLLDCHPTIRVILPTEDGLRSVTISDLMPLAAPWTVDGGTEQVGGCRTQGVP